MSGPWTCDDIEDEIQLALQHNIWATAKQLRKCFPDDCADMFWGALSALYKAKTIERQFDVHGEAIYRLAAGYE
jgi:hypothetical protein